jgi:hypothetical protein
MLDRGMNQTNIGRKYVIKLPQKPPQRPIDKK